MVDELHSRRGLSGLCAALIEGAVKDARGRAGSTNPSGKKNTRSARQRRTFARHAEVRIALAKRWLAGEHKGLLSVFDCCHGVGWNPAWFIEKLRKHGDIP